MGHYQDYYDLDQVESDKKHLQSVDKELRKFIKEGEIEDKDFVLTIILNVKTFRSFAKAILFLTKMK